MNVSLASFGQRAMPPIKQLFGTTGLSKALLFEIIMRAT